MVTPRFSTGSALAGIALVTPGLLAAHRAHSLDPVQAAIWVLLAILVAAFGAGAVAGVVEHFERSNTVEQRRRADDK